MGGYEGLKPNTECSMPRTESGGHFDLAYKKLSLDGTRSPAPASTCQVPALFCFLRPPPRKGELQTAVYGIVSDAHAAEPRLPFSD